MQEVAAQTVPAAPVPPALPADPAPPPPTPTAHDVRNVVITKDGKTTRYQAADIDAHLAAHDRVAIRPMVPHGSRMIVKMEDDPATRIEVQSIPAVSSAECGIGTGKPSSMVIDTGRGQKRKIVICTDRIEKITAEAMVTARNSGAMERNAYTQGLKGLTDARTKIVSDAGMGEADRARALSAIDQSIVEMKSQLARMD